MAFQDPHEASYGGASSPDLVGKVLEVSVDQQNPMLSTLTVEADPSDNLGHYSGTYTLRMDDSKSTAERVRFAQKARDEGGGFCGAIINDASARMKGRKLHFEGISLTGEQEATTSWIKSYRHDRLRRPGIVHTTEEPIRGSNSTDSGRKAAKVFAISVINTGAFSVDDQEKMQLLAKHADDNFKRGTTPKDMMHNDRNVLRSSMPITEATFAVLDNDSGEIHEYTRTFDKKQPPSPQSDAYPEHYADNERVNSYTGKPVKLPRDGADMLSLAESFKSYVAERYPGRNVTPICIESTRLMASTKVQQNPDMFYPVDVADGKYASPLQQIHQANQTSFRTEPGNDKTLSRGVFHPDIRIQFAPNAGSTYSRYVRTDFNHLPDDKLNQPWLASCTFNGEPLKLAEALAYPVANAVLPSAVLNAQAQAPAAHEQPHQNSPAQEQQQNPPAQEQPHDDAFDQSEALDQEAAAHNHQMREYEQHGAYLPAASSSEPQDSTAAVSQPAAAAPAPAPAASTAPTPEAGPSMDVDHLAHSADDCPFDDLDFDDPQTPTF